MNPISPETKAKIIKLSSQLTIQQLAERFGMYEQTIRKIIAKGVV